MIAEHHLVGDLQHSHDLLVQELETAASRRTAPEQPRQGFEDADTFLATASRHVNTVESVLLPLARKRVPHGHDLVRRHVRASKDLEVALVNAKGREYGSAYAVTMRWPEVWAAVRTTLAKERQTELALARRLAETLDDAELDKLAEQVSRSEPRAATRPHPHAPHSGPGSRTARRVLHAVDAFWDNTEARMVPEPARAPRKKPGLMAQYLLADPRFDEDD